MPIKAVIAVRDRNLRSKAPARRVWGLLAAVLRHRRLTPLTDFVLPDNPEIRLTVTHSRLVQLIFWYGARYEGAETFWWRKLCGQATRILEVGANAGYYTVQGAHAAPSTPYITVEANPEAAAIVAANVELNRLGNVEVVQAAVVDDDAPATMQLSLPDQERYAAPTGAYLAEGGEGIANRPAATSVTVPTRPMSQLVDGVDLLKLDIEGYEATVLESVLPWLLSERPTIVVEVLRDVPRLRKLIVQLREEAGYEVRAIGETELHVITDDELSADVPLPRYGSRDVILIPPERLQSL
ncbi:FkbM family methyltransferase [Actinomadura sp. NAK00032]|uniref:FkbM family methyltransferase n=1 Tax=Actinomadura sp. NAK00032 TaxID=2742128 RepID=UPI0015905AA5|nr:FkbM family methyltransferase [Actinomadura sp. NAK00032]QKW36318.1 FkbM family methyltransferase [Actinomadura sp. NAK00032]